MLASCFSGLSYACQASTDASTGVGGAVAHHSSFGDDVFTLTPSTVALKKLNVKTFKKRNSYEFIRMFYTKVI
jgi:hypothetical protein